MRTTMMTRPTNENEQHDNSTTTTSTNSIRFQVPIPDNLDENDGDLFALPYWVLLWVTMELSREVLESMRKCVLGTCQWMCGMIVDGIMCLFMEPILDPSSLLYVSILLLLLEKMPETLPLPQQRTISEKYLQQQQLSPETVFLSSPLLSVLQMMKIGTNSQHPSSIDNNNNNNNSDNNNYIKDNNLTISPNAIIYFLFGTFLLILFSSILIILLVSDDDDDEEEEEEYDSPPVMHASGGSAAASNSSHRRLHNTTSRSPASAWERMTTTNASNSNVSNNNYLYHDNNNNIDSTLWLYLLLLLFCMESIILVLVILSLSLRALHFPEEFFVVNIIQDDDGDWALLFVLTMVWMTSLVASSLLRYYFYCSIDDGN